MDYEFPPDVIRSPAEVARRALALFSIMGLAFGASKPEVIEWLGQTDLYSELAPSELRFIEAEAPLEKQIVDAGWLRTRVQPSLRAVDHRCVRLFISGWIFVPKSSTPCTKSSKVSSTPAVPGTSAISSIMRATLS
jgi:Domain of unknown function (DUF4272)